MLNIKKTFIIHFSSTPLTYMASKEKKYKLPWAIFTAFCERLKKSFSILTDAVKTLFQHQVPFQNSPHLTKIHSQFISSESSFTSTRVTKVIPRLNSCHSGYPSLLNFTKHSRLLTSAHVFTSALTPHHKSIPRDPFSQCRS